MEKKPNHDLVLREHLAVERTRLANERTLLSYVRTGLYFVIAGSTLSHVVESSLWKVIGDPLIVVGLLIELVGFARFLYVRRKIKETRKHIGQASIEFTEKARRG